MTSNGTTFLSISCKPIHEKDIVSIDNKTLLVTHINDKGGFSQSPLADTQDNRDKILSLSDMTEIFPVGGENSVHLNTKYIEYVANKDGVVTIYLDTDKTNDTFSVVGSFNNNVEKISSTANENLQKIGLDLFTEGMPQDLIELAYFGHKIPYAYENEDSKATFCTADDKTEFHTRISLNEMLGVIGVDNAVMVEHYDDDETTPVKAIFHKDILNGWHNKDSIPVLHAIEPDGNVLYFELTKDERWGAKALESSLGKPKDPPLGSENHITNE